MDKIFEYIHKILKKSGDKQAYFVYSKEFRSTMDKPIHLIQIVWSKKDIAPTRLAAYNREDLVKELKKYYRSKNADWLAKQYHLNQIDASERVIKYHKDVLKGLEKPKKAKKK